MKKAVLAMMLLAASMFAAPRVSFGISFGAPAPVYARPVSPGPGYVWVDGYYAPNGAWVAGYWTLPPAPVVIGPRIVERRFVPEHFDHDRDFRRDYHDRDSRDHDFHRDFRR